MEASSSGRDPAAAPDRNALYLKTAIGLGVLTALYVISRHNYLVFHTLAEFFSIAVAAGLFLILWNTRAVIENKSLILLGIAYLYVGGIDLIHTLSYKGMGVLGPETGANPATQLWIWGRYMESATLCAFTSMSTRKFDSGKTFLFYGAITALGLLSIFHWKNFPACYVEGAGLTPFKIVSEYLICAILAMGLALMYRNRKAYDPVVYRYMTAAIAMTILAELAFTFYVSVYGISNLLGHYFKIVSFYFVYRALIQSGLRRPHEIWFQQTTEREKKYRALFERSNDGIILHDLQGHIMDANTRALSLLGYNKSEIRRLSVRQLHPASEIGASAKAVARTSQAGHARFETRFLRKDGTIVHVEISASIIDRETGTVQGIIRDITDRKENEKALWETTERFRKVFDSQPDAILVLSPRTPATVVESNPAVHEMFQYGSDEIIGKTVELFHVDPQHLKNFQQQLHRSLEREGFLQNFPFFMKRKDGTVFPSEHTVVELKSSAGDRTGWVSIIRDMTEKRQLEDRLQQAQKMESIGNLAGGIAHDFNNILFPIVGMAEMLVDDLAPGSIERENAAEIFKAGQRGSGLVKQILAFSRQAERRLAPTRIQHILKEVMKLSRSTIPAYIDIDQDIQPDCGLIMADPTQIHQVAMNIITNAYHAVEAEGGTISVMVREMVLDASDLPKGDLEPGPYVQLSISDTGHGMTADIQAKIFDPYFTTKGQGKGTGLGLAVVYGIVQEHRGTIQVFSEIGKGTTFLVYLPLMGNQAEEKAVNAVDENPTGTERILLVDDEAAVVKIETQMLRRLGYRVTSRLNSLDAMALFHADPGAFDLVVSDMAMPNLPGDQLARHLIAIRPDIPIIICTGFSERLSRQKADEIGIRGILMKPVIKHDLARMVRHVLDDTGQNDLRAVPANRGRVSVR